MSGKDAPMHRGVKPAKPKAEVKGAATRKAVQGGDSRVRDLEKRLAEALEREEDARTGEAEALKREAEARQREAEALEDQAVIAIENGRLLTALQEKNSALAEALDQQTATADILRVIASSPTDLQAVLDAVAETVARLCEATDVLIHRVDGQMLPIAASFGSFAATYPPGESFPIIRGSVVGRAVLERRTIHVHDLAAESDEEFPLAKEFQRRYGHRTVLTTPLMREGTPLGAIWIRRTQVRPFSPRQIKLLETFADQAVIAIENVRLFKEIQKRNSELSEALAQQTATGEVLRVISRSVFDLEPVLETLIENATRLGDADAGAIFRFDGELMRRRRPDSCGKRNRAFFRLAKLTTNRPPGTAAAGGTRHGPE